MIQENYGHLLFDTNPEVEKKVNQQKNFFFLLHGPYKQMLQGPNYTKENEVRSKPIKRTRRSC